MPNSKNQQLMTKEKLWEHLRSIPTPSVETLIDGRMMQYYVEAAYDFMCQNFKFEPIKDLNNNAIKFRLNGFATGNYQISCCECGKFFVGDKRAVQCLECAIKRSEENSTTLQTVKVKLLSIASELECILDLNEETKSRYSQKLSQLAESIVGNGKLNQNSDSIPCPVDCRKCTVECPLEKKS